MSFVVAALVWVALCVLVAWRYPRAVAAVGDEAWQASLTAELEAASSEAEKVALLNERLADAEHLLSRDDGLPKVVGWLMVAGCGGLLVAVLTRGWQLAEAVRWAGFIGLVGAIGVFLAAAAARRGRRAAHECRQRIDRGVAALVGPSRAVLAPIPARRGSRGRPGQRRSRAGGVR